MQSTEEIWKDIPGYAGFYQASTFGRVRSLDRWITCKSGPMKFYKGQMMKLNYDEDGYLRTCITDANHKNKEYSVHRLVAMTYTIQISSSLIDQNCQLTRRCNRRS